MKNRLKPIIITILMLTMLVTSYIAIAAEYGSKEDPLVSLSYITDVLMPDTMNNIDKMVEEKTAEYMNTLDNKMKTFEDQFNIAAQNSDFVKKVSEQVAKAESASATVDVKSGQTLLLDSGTEFIVRTGSGKISSTNGIINLTTGTQMSNNATVSLNNLYVSAENAQGFVATSNSTVMVFGSYIVK